MKTPKKDYELVQMTPSIAPGVDASPLMTWGDIEGTPMVLDANATPGRPKLDLLTMPLRSLHGDSILNYTARLLNSGPSFEVKESSQREKLAHSLESKSVRGHVRNHVVFVKILTEFIPSQRKQKEKARQWPTPLRPSPLSSSRKGHVATGSQSIRDRLMSIRSTKRTPFGSDSELRASYATPLLPPRHLSKRAKH